jgi:hypothetical protein
MARLRATRISQAEGNGPNFQSPQKRVLGHVVGQIETAEPERAGEKGDQLPCFRAEEMLSQSGTS